MQALILNSGMGSRMGGFTEKIKSMVLNGKLLSGETAH